MYVSSTLQHSSDMESICNLYTCNSWCKNASLPSPPSSILQGVMVRLMLVLAPVMCILAGIGVSSILTAFMKNVELFESRTKKKKMDSTYPVKSEVRAH